jgi:actin-related protein
MDPQGTPESAGMLAGIAEGAGERGCVDCLCHTTNTEPMPTSVFDVGTSSARFGSAGDSHPQTVAASSGVAQGRIANWDQVRKHIPAALAAGTDVLVVESMWERDALANRRRWSELLFESSKASGVSFAAAPVLASFANARTTSLVLDMGAAGCVASVVVDGWVLRESNMELSEFGGLALDSVVAKGSSKAADLAAARIKREKPEFKLPDGTDVCGLLFGESAPAAAALGPNAPLHELVFTAATRNTSDELRHNLLSNVVLCGALSQTERVPERLRDALANLSLKDQPRVIAAAPKDRAMANWIGGSILASLPVFQEVKVDKKEYEEAGLGAVMKKCP